MKLKVAVTLLLVFVVIIPTLASAQTWSGITELTPNDNADDEYPASVVYNNKLYVVWQSDNNIVMKSYDGVSWSSAEQVSDSSSEYTNQYLQLTVYDGKLYIVWETNEDTISNGNDWDIVLCCYDSGIGNIAEVTDSNDSANDCNPQMTVYNNKLYIVWQSDNDIITRNYNATIGSINNFNAWSNIENITSSEANDYAPQISVYANNLCILWVTEDENISSGSDSDVVMKYGNEIIELTPENDNMVDQHPRMTAYNNELYVIWQTNNPEITNGEDDDIVIKSYNTSSGLGNIFEVTSNDVSDFAPQVTVDDKIYIAWLSNSKELMMRSYDGNVFDSSVCVKSMEQGYVLITKTCVSLCVYNDTLYIIWQTKDETISDGYDWDIVVRCYNMNTAINTTQAQNFWSAFVIIVSLVVIATIILSYFVLRPKIERKKENKRLQIRKKRRGKIKKGK
ncbi:MAG: hypothetical protein L6265_04735 [Thermoplasmatales archaeon]|nr:hypothetical protein [Thermoplasmatales archaeon]